MKNMRISDLRTFAKVYLPTSSPHMQGVLSYDAEHTQSSCQNIKMLKPFHATVPLSNTSIICFQQN
jgi:hypothetical protein